MCPYTAKQTLPPAAQVEVEVGVEAVGPTICTGSLRLLVSSPLAISLSTECTWPRISVQLAERPWTYGMVSHKKTPCWTLYMSPEDLLLSEAPILIFSKSLF